MWIGVPAFFNTRRFLGCHNSDMENLDQLIKAINSYPADIKGEVLMADLIQEGYSWTDFLVFFNSTFKRGFGKDIDSAERFLINDLDEVLAIRLARDGLYDLLPEGVFHAGPDSAKDSAKGMATESRKEAKIEENTRKFFQPYENEFFYERTLLELKEREILQKLNDGSWDTFFIEFWKIDKLISKELAIKLCSLLPFVKDIVGNFKMTSSCLGAILNEQVSYEIFYSREADFDNRVENGSSVKLGQQQLGMNAILSGDAIENRRHIRYCIGPLKNSDITPYLEGGDIARLIEIFNSYFIPMEMESGFEVIIPEEKHGFVLGSEECEPVMGYNTII